MTFSYFDGALLTINHHPISLYDKESNVQLQKKSINMMVTRFNLFSHRLMVFVPNGSTRESLWQ